MTQSTWLPYVVFDSALPVSMCDNIIEIHDRLEYTRGGIMDSGKPTYSSHRNVDLQGSELQWLNALIVGYSRLANHLNFNYDLTDQDKERLQFSKYDEGMYFRDHMDFAGYKDTVLFTRKLSVTVQLSDPNSYKGGDLIIDNCENGKPFTCPRTRGTIIVFDSRWIHRVKPIKSGRRYSLVKWIHGDTPLK